MQHPAPPPRPFAAAGSRRDFLKNAAALGLGAAVLAGGGPLDASPFGAVASDGPLSATRPRKPGLKPVHDLTTRPLEKVRVGIIGLGRGNSLLRDMLGLDFVEVAALCDLRADRVGRSLALVRDKSGAAPKTYVGDERAWEKLVAQDDLDIVYVATPWEWHVPMAVLAMEHGKHAFVEVSAAVTVDECWELVDASERARRHCAILENCCYGQAELFVRNLVREGVFGELKHAECAYIHELRDMLFNLDSEGNWRREYHKKLNGNLYPTHGLGPVARYLGIGRGDQFKSIVSVSSGEHSLSKWLAEKNPNGGRHAGESYRCGDINTSIIKTELGRTIMVQHDVVSPRPYSRVNALSGTGATFLGYPNRLALDEPARLGLGLKAKSSHAWLDSADMAKMQERFAHPLVRELWAKAKGAGHGGMDYLMNHRLLDCVRRGATPDLTVYDAAAWSCVLELSVRSVALGGAPVAVPDFTRGAWRTLRPAADPLGA
ncbi:MAG: Gfo/Idh/MocA family oxidoreductase [Opitutaceae bacterium]|nr:Gfo/Idh/MocA family oxidoreductase [Opitutaceae bacterium]